MKEFLKKPANWGGEPVLMTARSLENEKPVNPNRARIEAKIAEIKIKLESKNK